VHTFIHQFFELTITGLAVGAIYALVALGYTMVYGVLQLINFAHSEVFMYGTFAMAWVFVFIHGTGSVTESLWQAAPILIVALIAAMVASGGVALLVERFAYRPLIKRDAPKLVALISAIGASFALSETMGLRDRIAGWFGLRGSMSNYVANARNNYSNPVTVQPHGLFTIGDYKVTDVDLLVIGAALLMMVGLELFVRRTRAGRSIRAVAEDPEAASLMGVNSTRTIQLTFLIGGLMAGVAATLYMVRIGTTSSGAGFIFGVKAFTAAVMGGIGNLRGALLGGLVLGVAENWGSAFFGTSWKDVVSFALLVLILLVRPSGILGESLRKARA
jgi:branched-chain amino acid transport system permease protein